MVSGWFSETFLALKHPHYRTLWIGTTLAFLGFMMQWVVQAVVAFDLTGKNAAVGIVGLGMGVSQLVISPFGGVIADRVSKRKLLLIGQTIIGLSFATTGFLILTDNITILLLVISSFIMGVVFAFIAPARQAWIGELLPRESMANGIALQQVSQTATRVLGPSVAGILVSLSFVGTGGTYLFMAGIFIFVVATLATLPPTKSTATKGYSVRSDMMLGIRHVMDRPALQLLGASFISVVICGYSWQVMLPGLLENELGLNPDSTLSWLMSSSAISGLTVSLLLASRAASPVAWKLMFLGAGMLGAALILLSVTPGYGPTIGIMLVLGAGTGGFQLLNNSLVMQMSDPAYFGRIMALTMLAWGFNGLIGFPLGMLADAIGERQTFFVMGIAVLIVTSLSVAWFLAVQDKLGRKIPAPVEPRLAGGK